MPYSITREDGTADAMALQDALNVLKASAGWDSPTAARLRELRDSIESQLPKAPVEEPTEWGSVVMAHDTGGSQRMRWILTGRIWRAERHDYCTDWGGLLDVEVLRIGIGPAPAEAVEADKAHLSNRHGETVEIDLDTIHPEPSPEQVEAERAARIYADPFDDAPVEGDPIEALVQESMTRDWLPTDDNGDCLRAFAARVLEVGGQQTRDVALRQRLCADCRINLKAVLLPDGPTS